MHQVRQPAVAGAFYPEQALTLAHDVSAMLKANHPARDAPSRWPKAIIVPHAGYVYSGSTAAKAYACLAGGRSTIRRVILLGPVHRVPVHGLALPGVDAFATPLGVVMVDQDAVAMLAPLPQVVVNRAAHAPEHSLEVQVPFLQSVLDDFQLVPLVVGNATPADVVQVLNLLWGGPETLIVVSSDLSHYLSYQEAQAMDHDTVMRILSLSSPVSHQQACGGTPISGLLLAARQHGLQAHLLGVCNSGDTAGDKRRVVGYGAFAFTSEVGNEH